MHYVKFWLQIKCRRGGMACGCSGAVEGPAGSLARAAGPGSDPAPRPACWSRSPQGAHPGPDNRFAGADGRLSSCSVPWRRNNAAVCPAARLSRVVRRKADMKHIAGFNAGIVVPDALAALGLRYTPVAGSGGVPDAPISPMTGVVII